MSTATARSLRVVGVVAAVLSAAIGSSMIAVAVTLGHCSAFGGRCPADPAPLWDDDTFGMSAMGAALITGPLLALRRGPHRWSIALAGAVVAALLIGLLVRSAANG